MFCQHTEPAVYYTCRVSSCDDLKLGKYTTQDIFRILNNIKQKTYHFSIDTYFGTQNSLFISWWYSLASLATCVSTSPGLPMNTTKKNDIFNFWLLSIISNLCVGWSCRWDLHISLSSLSLSLLYCNSVCVHCQPQVWHLFMLSVWEKRRQEKGSPMVISTTIFSLLITTGDSFLRPHDQAYHQEMIVSIFDLYDICR